MNWCYFAKRGWQRLLDAAVGRDTTMAERQLLAFASISGIALAYWMSESVPFWARLVLMGLAADMTGGIVANTLPSVSQWWKSRSNSVLALFLAAHAAHCAAAVLTVSIEHWRWGLFVYVYAVTAAWSVILLANRSGQLGLALLLAAFGYVLAEMAGRPDPALAWFAPVLFLKLVVAFPVHVRGG